MFNIQRLLISGLFIILAAHVAPAEEKSELKQNDFNKTPYPRIAMLWSPLRGDNSTSSFSRHNLMMVGASTLGLRPNSEPEGLSDGYTSDSVIAARAKVDEIRRLNPDIVIIGDMPFYEYPEKWLEPNHRWFLRVDGKLQQFWPGTYRMDWNNSEYRDVVIKKTLSLLSAGVDGVFYDNLRNEPEPWIALFKSLREKAGDDFLLMANAGYSAGEYSWAAPWLNGFMYESGWSHNRTEWDGIISEMRKNQSLLRAPRISIIERFEEIRDHAGWPGDEQYGKRPETDPAARRWSLCYSLIIGDFYYLFSDNTSHRHDWYPEYDVKIGLPVEEGKKINDHVWSRRYEKAEAYVNLPGAAQSFHVEKDSERRDSLTGRVAKTFDVAPGDGLILLEK